MGLYVTAYSRIVRVEGYNDNDELPDGVTQLFVSDGPPDLAGGINDGYYRFEDCHCFCAGSGHGYGDWLDELARLAGYAPPKEFLDQLIGELSAIRDGRVVTTPQQMARRLQDWAEGLGSPSEWVKSGDGPFSELIDFSSAGVIGTGYCQKLAKDFADFEAKANTHDNLWFRKRYADWQKAFELASGGGAVYLH
ncbi:hypothetical protein H6F46_11970 [Limnothrix sp. FACHB-1083]|uniref:hypothetical protein n=1 Tax=unclassified Limnothrix TaxID=2632864 RepID=UPI001680B9AC|nr:MULTISPECIES: hypothetical protein [unclassified Limnothrix]MBD2161407.1 hypothetical protein [Limnothrix sp. FACHB-1083]MBD2192081.1 hypothetical protein [Limnothrix sp. FACHB-1088]